MRRPLVLKLIIIFLLSALNLTGDYDWGRTNATQEFLMVLTTLGRWGVTLFGAYAIIQWYQRRYPQADQNMNRRRGAFVFVLLLCFATSVASDFPEELILQGNLDNLGFNWVNHVFGAVLVSIIVLGVFELNYTGQLNARLVAEKQELERLQLQSRYESLKSQVDPHFLFNSLNTLSALIRTDPKRAEQFVEELSRVYRYLLRGREHDLSSLEDELEFIRSYEHLLKSRFGKGFVLNIAVDEHLLGRRLPAQALQLLVENTVKHNVISEAQPLTVTIRTVGNDRLEVHNNLQRRNSRMHSNKVGLVNITERFRLLGAPSVQVEETATDFHVTLPLLGE